MLLSLCLAALEQSGRAFDLPSACGPAAQYNFAIMVRRAGCRRDAPGRMMSVIGGVMAADWHQPSGKVPGPLTRTIAKAEGKMAQTCKMRNVLTLPIRLVLIFALWSLRVVAAFLLSVRILLKSVKAHTMGDALCDPAASQGHESACDMHLHAAKPSTSEAERGPAPIVFGGKAVSRAEHASLKQLLSQVDATLASMCAADEVNDNVDLDWLQSLSLLTLLPILRSKRGDVADALTSVMNTAHWRHEFGVHQLFLQEKDRWSLEGFFDANGADREIDWLPHFAEKNGEQNPVLLYRAAKHTPYGIPEEQWVRFFVYQCEWARRTFPAHQVSPCRVFSTVCVGVCKSQRKGKGVCARARRMYAKSLISPPWMAGKVVLLVDRVGSGLGNQDPTIVRALAPIIQEHYPQLLGKVYVAPVNTVLWVIWSVVRVVLDQDIKSVSLIPLAHLHSAVPLTLLSQLWLTRPSAYHTPSGCLDAIVSTDVHGLSLTRQPHKHRSVVRLLRGESWRTELRSLFHPACLPQRLGGDLKLEDEMAWAGDNRHAVPTNT